MNTTTRLLTAFATAVALAAPAHATEATQLRTLTVDGMEIHYREAGDPAKPALVLLHGFPSSSYMYRTLIPKLAGRFHVIAPDYPGSGLSPAKAGFTPTFEQLSIVMEHFLAQKQLSRYALYVQDFGGPVGFRIAARNPAQVTALIIQNANAYDEGLSVQIASNINILKVGLNPETEGVLEHILSPDGVKFMYQHGTRQPAQLDNSTWTTDSAVLRDPAAKAVQKGLLVDYDSNLKQYSAWQAYFRKAQPPTLIVWGKNDPLFNEAGARAFQRDLPKAELHLLDTGHFALEEDADAIADKLLAFAARNGIAQ